MLADTNLDEYEVGTTDFDTCFLQTRKFANGNTYVVKLWEPKTDLTEFYDCDGPQYGGYI